MLVIVPLSSTPSVRMPFVLFSITAISARLMFFLGLKLL